MIVLAIITAVLVVGGNRLFNNNNQMRSTVRQLAVITRQIRNVARLQGTTSRLAIRMDDEKGHSFWVESAPGHVLLFTENQEEELKRLTDLQREGIEKKSKFELEPKVLKSPVKLPRGLFFESVEYAARQKAITEGTSYIHFFPSGLSEDAVIHVTDRKNLNWTIAINPLTGQAQVFERKVSLKELRAP